MYIPKFLHIYLDNILGKSFLDYDYETKPEETRTLVQSVYFCIFFSPSENIQNKKATAEVVLKKIWN